jgi:lysophospholipase L1-like esterase
MRSRFCRGLAAVVAVLAVAFTAGPQVAAHADTPVYVALGDSYAAGPIIPLQEQPWGCLKSTNNYAKHVASQLGLELRDATCSGADTNDMTNAQGVTPAPNPPQFDRLDAGVALVTLQIGGNDIGFGGIAQTCAQAGFEMTSCKSKYVVNGRDELRERIAATAPKVAAVIQGIHQRSPAANVYVLGYSGIFRIATPTDATASCPAMLVSEEDAQYLRGIEEALNAMIATQAGANAATYIDVYGPSAGKTACDLPVLRWIEPIVPVNAAAPLHPNIVGMMGVADLIVRQATGTSP